VSPLSVGRGIVARRRGAVAVESALPLFEHHHAAPFLAGDADEVVALFVLEGDQAGALTVVRGGVAHRGGRGCHQELLSTGRERGLLTRIARHRSRPERHGAVGDRVPRLAWRAQELTVAP
jgi:hypothetical protein